VPSPVVELLAALDVPLRRLGLRWYLFGAQAAILHGAARLTADVDVTVDLGSQALGVMLEAVGAAGFAPRVTDVAAFAERTRVVPLVHVASAMPVDVVLAGPGPEELFFGRIERRVVDGVLIPVASAEDVIVMKLLAGRPKDVDDVVAILAAHPDTLDLDLVRGLLAELEEALERGDLQHELERALLRSRDG
jgi:uncharacterized nucleotidyltransferase DUF6036